jgi:hypothetical protein
MVFSMRLRTIAIVTVTALLLSGMYLAAAHFAAQDLAVGPQDRSYRLDIGEEKADVKILEARQGDRVTFVVTSTRAGQFYVHSPEVEGTLLPGIETSLTVTAKYSGRYYVHFHQINCADPDESHRELAVLDVMPN